jgi:hypothetical protein
MLKGQFILPKRNLFLSNRTFISFTYPEQSPQSLIKILTHFDNIYELIQKRKTNQDSIQVLQCCLLSIFFHILYKTYQGIFAVIQMILVLKNETN